MTIPKPLLWIALGLLFVLGITVFVRIKQIEKERDQLIELIHGTIKDHEKKIQNDLRKNEEFRIWLRDNLDDLVRHKKALDKADSLSKIKIVQIPHTFDHLTDKELQDKMIEEYNKSK